MHDPARPTPQPDLVPSLARGIDEAGLRIFAAAASGTENTAVSPASIGLAFGMADAGASGDVARAIEARWGLPTTDAERLAAFNAYQQHLSTPAGATHLDPATGREVALPVMSIANRVFTDTAFEPLSEYVGDVSRWFGAGAQPAPLRTNPGEASDTINGWVSEHTDGLIGELVEPSVFTDDSRLMLVNALAMKARWREELNPDETERAPFTLLDGTRTEVDLMEATETASGVAPGDGYVAASLAYAGDALEMVVILPDAGRFERVRERLGLELLEEIDAFWTDDPFVVRIPRFEIASAIDLRDVIEHQLGWDGIFDTGELDGIGDNLVISDARHAVAVKVDETGTEAAAATSIGISLTSLPPPPVEVIADRPFLYVVRDVDTGATLFVGQVVDPTH